MDELGAAAVAVDVPDGALADPVHGLEEDGTRIGAELRKRRPAVEIGQLDLALRLGDLAAVLVEPLQLQETEAVGGSDACDRHGVLLQLEEDAAVGEGIGA